MLSFFELTTFWRLEGLQYDDGYSFLRCIRYPESFASNRNKDTSRWKYHVYFRKTLNNWTMFYGWTCTASSPGETLEVLGDLRRSSELFGPTTFRDGWGRFPVTRCRHRHKEWRNGIKIPWDEKVHWKFSYHFKEVDFACRHGMYLMSESFWGYCDVELHVSTQGWLKMDGSPAALHSGHVSTLHGCPCWSSQYWCWCLRENMKDWDVGWCWDVGWNWGKLCLRSHLIHEWPPYWPCHLMVSSQKPGKVFFCVARSYTRTIAF